MLSCFDTTAICGGGASKHAEPPEMTAAETISRLRSQINTQEKRYVIEQKRFIQFSHSIPKRKLTVLLS